MKPPRRVPLVDREVRTWTENISDAAVADLTTALLRRVGKIDRRYDIPYIAGYSRDGSTAFIDRHMPSSFAYRGRRIQTDRFLPFSTPDMPCYDSPPPDAEAHLAHWQLRLRVSMSRTAECANISTMILLVVGSIGYSSIVSSL